MKKDIPTKYLPKGRGKHQMNFVDRWLTEEDKIRFGKMRYGKKEKNQKTNSQK